MSIQTIFSNQILNITITALLIAQLLKLVVMLAVHRKIDFRRFIGSGGMPSSHSSTVVALATCVARKCGIGSTEFAIACVLAIIVMYDAAGVRRAVGTHARTLNKILENWNPSDPVLTEKKLKELVGHTPLQVYAGALLGLAIGMVGPM